MHALADRLEFAPPPTPGMVRSMGLALLAHAFLLAALTLGVQWKRETL
ncbi:MAG: protein TolA, partial [Comamonadaceae bacterium]